MNEVDRNSKILFLVLFIALAGSVLYTYNRMFVAHDYFVVIGTV